MFDTFDLSHALRRSQQEQGRACGGLRRATSAPHSMDLLGVGAVTPDGRQQRTATYLSPTGGPMRRIQSSLGMRRSSSFFWTPAAHHDFERAIHALSARGVEVSASTIMEEMSHVHVADLKLADIDKHLRKKALLQRRVLQQLSMMPPQSDTASARPNAFQSHGSFRDRLASSGGLRVPNAIAEEPPTAVAGAHANEAAGGMAAAAVAAAAVSDGLAQQFQAQRMQHLQLAAAREALLAGAEAQAQMGSGDVAIS